MKYKVLLEIANTCENCPINTKCVEKECVLFRIEKLILKDMKNGEKRIIRSNR